MCIAQQPGYAPLVRQSADESVLMGLCLINPAAIATSPVESYTTLSASFDRKKQPVFRSFQGNEQASFRAAALGVVNKADHALMGHAAYSIGKSFNTRWSDVSDNERIGPYRVADSTGGDRNAEEYIIGGALVRKTSGGFSLGISATYRAEGTYRTTDPRPSTNVSQIDLGAGLTFPMHSSYLVGLSLQGGNYVQRVSVSNANSARKDMFYFMYGFGLYNNQISGSSSSFSLDYDGWRWGLTGFFKPAQGHKGWVVVSNYLNDAIETQVDDVIPGIYYSNSTSGTIGFSFADDRNNCFVGLDSHYKTGKGVEQYYETVVVDQTTKLTNKQLLSRGNKYFESDGLIAVTSSLQANRGRQVYLAHVDLGLNSIDANYKTTSYKQTIRNLFVNLNTGISKHTEVADISVSVNAGYRFNLHASLNASWDSKIAQGQVIPDHFFMTSDVLNYGALVNYKFNSGVFHSMAIAAMANAIAYNGNSSCSYSLKLSYLL